MTNFSIANQDQIKSLIAQQLADYQNALDEVGKMETESVFSEMAAEREEARAYQLESDIDRWESFKSTFDNIISTQLATINDKLSQINSIKAAAIDKKKDAAIRKESFKLLSSISDSLKVKLNELNEKINNCSDPAQKQAMIEKKEQLQTFYEKSKKIQDIKDDKQAMKEFKNLSEEMFIAYYPDKTLTTDQKKELLAKANSGSDDTSGSFQTISNIWSQYKVGLSTAKTQLEAKVQAMQNIIQAGQVAAPILSTIAPVVGTAAQIGLNLASTAATSSASAQSLDQVNKELAQYEKMIKTVDQIQEKVDKEFKKVEEKVHRIEERHHRRRKEIILSNNNNLTQDQLESIKSNASKMKENQVLFDSAINEGFDTVQSINDDLNYNEKTYKKLQNQTDSKKAELNKQTEVFISNANNNSPDNDVVKRLTDFVSGNTNDEAKIVLDKSLFALKDQLSEKFGDRVVVDKRNGNRRGDTDRRLTTQNNNNEANHARADIAGRRKGDRREGNHIFISDETIKKLYINS